MGKTTNQCRPVAFFKFIKFAAINNSGNHFTDIIRDFKLTRYDAMQLFGCVKRLLDFSQHKFMVFTPVKITYDGPGKLKRMIVIISQMIRDPGNTCMDITTAKILGRNNFARCRLDKWWSSQKNRPLFFDNDIFITHRRDIGPARRAGAHHNGNLRNII